MLRLLKDGQGSTAWFTATISTNGVAMNCESMTPTVCKASGRRAAHVVAGLAATPLLLAAGPAWPQAKISKGGSLIVAIQDNPPHLLTGISVDILTICVAGQIYDTLIKMDSEVQGRSEPRQIVGRKRGRAEIHLPPRTGREMARRAAVHLGRREAHLHWRSAASIRASPAPPTRTSPRSRRPTISRSSSG